MNSERVKVLKSFIKDEPSNPFNKYALAMEYYESDPHTASNLLSELLEVHPEYLPTYFKAAHLYWEDEKWNQADETFQKGISLAELQGDVKAGAELKSAYQNFKFDRDD